MDPNVETKRTQQTVELYDCGAASQVTRGDFYQWPWFEAGSPPFIYTSCPYC